MLFLPHPLREQIRRHARESYPHECCGILLGTSDHHRQAVTQVIPAANIAPEATRPKRYDIDPRAILRADKTAAENHHEILGFYHSHPDHPAVPSNIDHALAWPDYLYAICSIHADGTGDLRAWRLVAPDQPLVEVTVET